MNNLCICWLSTHIFTARRHYKSFVVKGLICAWVRFNPFSVALKPKSGQACPFLKFLYQPQPHTFSRTPLINPSWRPLLTQHKTNTRDNHALCGIRTRDPSNQAAADLHLRPHGQQDRHVRVHNILNYKVTTVWVKVHYPLKPKIRISNTQQFISCLTKNKPFRFHDKKQWANVPETNPMFLRTVQNTWILQIFCGKTHELFTVKHAVQTFTIKLYTIKLSLVLPLRKGVTGIRQKRV
jgi:hypothetical protein